MLDAAIGTIIVLIYDVFGKSNQDTGGATAIFYLVILLILSICFYFNNDKIGFNLGVSGFTIISIMWMGGFETPSERLGLTFMILLFISLIFFWIGFKPTCFTRLMLLTLGFFPLYVSPAHAVNGELFLWVS